MHAVGGEEVAGPEALGKIFVDAGPNVDFVTDAPLFIVDDRVPQPAIPSEGSLESGEQVLSGPPCACQT